MTWKSLLIAQSIYRLLTSVLKTQSQRLYSARLYGNLLATYYVILFDLSLGLGDLGSSVGREIQLAEDVVR